METRKNNFLSVLLCFSGFGAGTLSINELAQILGSLTGFLSAAAVAYQIIVTANSQSKLTLAQAQKEQAQADLTKAEVEKINAQTEKQQIENDLLTKKMKK